MHGAVGSRTGVHGGEEMGRPVHGSGIRGSGALRAGEGGHGALDHGSRLARKGLASRRLPLHIDRPDSSASLAGAHIAESGTSVLRVHSSID